MLQRHPMGHHWRTAVMRDCSGWPTSQQKLHPLSRFRGKVSASEKTAKPTAGTEPRFPLSSPRNRESQTSGLSWLIRTNISSLTVVTSPLICHPACLSRFETMSWRSIDIKMEAYLKSYVVKVGSVYRGNSYPSPILSF